MQTSTKAWAWNLVTEDLDPRELRCSDERPRTLKRRRTQRKIEEVATIGHSSEMNMYRRKAPVGEKSKYFAPLPILKLVHN